jgi:hypothetical protein
MALDDNGKEIVPINLDETERRNLSYFITALRKANDPYLCSVLDFAESPATRIHVYSTRSFGSSSTSTNSAFEGEWTLDDIWESSVEPGATRLGMTLQSSSMLSSKVADILLSGKDVLSGKDQFALIAVLDELHHFYMPGSGAATEDSDHLVLFKHLLQLAENKVVNLPQVIIDELLREVSRIENQPKKQDQPGIEEQPKSPSVSE